MSRFVQGADRRQQTLLPECLDDYVAEDNPVRVVDVFVDELDLKGLGFEGMTPAATGRPAYHPAMLLKLYVYGYLNKVQSSRRLEREAQRNVELMWLTGRLAPDHKTIADFRRENGPAIQAACAQFVVLCRQLTDGREIENYISAATFAKLDPRMNKGIGVYGEVEKKLTSAMKDDAKRHTRSKAVLAGNLAPLIELDELDDDLKSHLTECARLIRRWNGHS